MAATYFVIEGRRVPCPADVEEKGRAAMDDWLKAETAAVKSGKSESWKQAEPHKRAKVPAFVRMRQAREAVREPRVVPKAEPTAQTEEN